MSFELTFRIAGSYTPATIPLERLGEYMVALGELLGEAANVHFDRLTTSSTVVHAVVEPAAMPKVERRVRSAAVGEGPPTALKAFRKLDDLLHDDNATGHLSGGENNVIHVDFAGKNRPTRIPYGPIKQIGVIEGEVFRVEGSDATVHVGVMDGQRRYSLEAPERMGQELAALFRKGLVRFHGEGTWYRHEEGAWELRKFKIDRVEGGLDAAPIGEAVEKLRAAGLGGWDNVPNPIGELLAERGTAASEH